MHNLFNLKTIFLVFLLILLFASCNPEKAVHEVKDTSTLYLKYAKQFKIEYKDSIKEISIFQPWSGSNKQFRYRLSPGGGSENSIVLPVDSVVCFSPTSFAMINALGLTDKIIAVTSIKDIYNAAFYTQFKASGRKELGNAGIQSMEALIDLSPQLIFESATGSAYDSFEKLEELKLKTVLFSAHTEPHPLGRAEWIKYIAAFFNQERAAESLFNSMEQRYQKIQKKMTGLNTRPLVFVGYPWKESWIVPGGNSYMAKLIEDAGGTYVYSNDTSSGNLYINVEDVLEKITACSIWLNPGISVTGAENLKNIPVINKKITAHLKIYNNNNRLNELGKNDFWESGIIQPDIILEDLAKIFHPELFPSYTLYYYRKIRE